LLSKAILEGYYQNVAFRVGNQYYLVYGEVYGKLSSSSSLKNIKPKYIVYSNLTKRDNQYFMSICYEIGLKDLMEISPKMLDKVRAKLKEFGIKE